MTDIRIQDFVVRDNSEVEVSYRVMVNNECVFQNTVAMPKGTTQEETYRLLREKHGLR
jgi:hypothetical protein